MGYGDEIIASFVVSEVGKRFPDKKIAISKPNSFPMLRRWDKQQSQIYQNNPYLINPAAFGHIHKSDLVYYPDWRGNRPRRFDKSIFSKKIVPLNPEVFDWLDEKYYTDEAGHKRFKAYPGSIFFSEEENSKINHLKKKYGDHILINTLSASTNKDWGIANWSEFVKQISSRHKMIHPSKSKIDSLPFYETKSFRDLLMLISSVKAVVTTEGGVHHAAAALGIPAVVLFGGRMNVEMMGYQDHLNISINMGRTPCHCRSGASCEYCEKCWRNLSPLMVYESFLRLVEDGNTKNICHEIL